jgi:hypothetical protein
MSCIHLFNDLISHPEARERYEKPEDGEGGDVRAERALNATMEWILILKNTIGQDLQDFQDKEAFGRRDLPQVALRK